MNQLVARSVLRALINGRNCNRCLSSSTPAALAASVGVVWPRGEKMVVGGEGFGFFGGVQWSRMMKTAAEDEKMKDKEGGAVAEKEGGGELMESSYWGISRPMITREDGTAWPWNCFMPWEIHQTDLSIDLSKHHVPKTFIDKVAYRTVKILRIPTDMFFQVGSRLVGLGLEFDLNQDVGSRFKSWLQIGKIGQTSNFKVDPIVPQIQHTIFLLD